MKKRLLSLFMALAMCVTMLPAAALGEESGETNYVAELEGVQYETLEAALDEMSEEVITLLGNVNEESLSTSVPTIIDMAGFSITADIEANDSLTLTDGTVIGNVVFDGSGNGVFDMTAPADAAAAIDGGLKVKSGASCVVRGAKVGVKGTLYMSSDPTFVVSGTEQAVVLTEEAYLSGKTIYGSADPDGYTDKEAIFDTDTYKVGGAAAKRLSNQRTGSTTPEPSQPVLTLTPVIAEIYPGQSAKFEVSYNGSDSLKAYIQKNGLDETIDAAYDPADGTVTVSTTEDVKAGVYKLYVHELNNESLKAEELVTVKNAVAKDSDGNYYEDVKTAIENAASGSTVTIIGNDKRVTVPSGVYVEKLLTLDLNGYTLDGQNLNLGRTGGGLIGKLTIIDSDSSGNGMVGVTVRTGNTLIFNPGNITTTLSELQFYGGLVRLYGGRLLTSGLYIDGNWSLANLIPNGEGLAYRQENGNQWITMADAQNPNYTIPTYNLVVMKCEHTGIGADGKCLYCGAACTHPNGYTDGKCPDCGAECPHTNIDESTYKCSECGIQMVVKAEAKDGTISYGTDLTAVMNVAEDGAVFTLLDDTTLSNNVEICDNNKTVTLNLNGHSIGDGRAFGVGGTAVWDAERTGKLIIAGKGDIQSPINIWRSGAIDLSGWKDGTINYLCSYGNTTVTGITSEGYINNLMLTDWQANDKCVALNSGRFGKITWVNFGKLELTLGNLLETGYAFQREDDQAYVSYNEKLLPIQSGISNINVVKCENHADSDGDGKCDYCNGQLAARVVDNNGTEYGSYTDLQDALDAQTAMGARYKAILLDNASGSYSINKGHAGINLNNYSINELIYSDDARTSLDGNGTINSITFRGDRARFATSTPRIGTLTIADGATWSSILPDGGDYLTFGNRFGYNVENADKTYTWYDRETVGSGASMNNVKVAQLPVAKEPQLMLDGKELTGESAVNIGRSIQFYVEAKYTYHANCVVYIRKQGDSAITNMPATENDSDYYECNAKTFDFSDIGVYDLWAEVTKSGYTRKSKIYTLNVAADLSDAVVELDSSEFTYTPNGSTGTEFAPQIKSVKLYGRDVPESVYTISGDTSAADAGSYNLVIEAKTGGGYSGSASASWKILPRLFDEVRVCDYIKRYDGTTEVTAEDIGNNHSYPPRFVYSGGPLDGIGLEYGKDYNITDLEANFTSPNTDSRSQVSFNMVLTNANYTFADENGNNTNTKRISQGMNIGRANGLPAGCEPDVGELAVVNNVAAEYTFDVSALLKTLPSPQEYLIRGYALSLVAINDLYCDSDVGASIDENGILKLPIKAVDAAGETSIGMVRVRVVTENYTDFYVTVNVSTKDKIVPAGAPTISDNSTITYGESIGSLMLSGKLHDNLNNVDVEGTFTWDTPDAVPNAGSYQAAWTFTPTGSNAFMYAQAIGTAEITVNKAALLEGVDYTAPTVIDGLVYSGSSQALHTTGSVAGGASMIKYTAVPPETAPANAWQDQPIEGINAGDYVVYYKVLGDENHLDSDYGTISCNIGKYKLTYDIVCLPKIYDGSVNADPTQIMSIGFFGVTDPEKEINLVKDTDYTIESITYESPNVGANFGGERVNATAVVKLNSESANAKNYEIESGRAAGYITPAPFENIDSYSGYTYKVRYNDTIAKSVTARTFGAANNMDYVIVSDGVVVGNSEILGALSNEYGYITFAVASGLSVDDVGKKCTENIKVYSKDYNYCSGELLFTVEIVDRATPVLSVPEITAVYDGEPLTNDEIIGTATIGRSKIEGTWSFDGSVPTNVADSGEYDVVFTPNYSEGIKSAKTKVTVTISPRDIKSDNIGLMLENNNFVYNRNEQRPNVNAEMNGKTLIAGTDYTVTYLEDVINSGEKTVTITGIGNFDGEAKLKYTIERKNFKPSVSMDGDRFIYDSSAKTPDVLVKDGDFVLVKGTDYTVDYKNNTNAGTATVDIAGIGNYTFSVSETFTIDKASTEFTTVPSAKTGLIYNGGEQALITEGAVNAGTAEYKLGENGTWGRNAPNAVDAGDYVVYYRIVGDENHDGTAEQSINVSIDKKDIAGANVKLGDKLVYNRNEQTQDIESVTADGLNVTYTVSGNTAVNAGEYTMTIVGSGNFKGEITQKFTVARKTVTADVTVNGTYIYNGNAIEPTDITVKDGDAVIPSDEYTLSYADNTNAGTAAVTVIDKNTGNYAVSGTGTFVIDKAIVSVKPNNAAKIYGDDAPSFELVSDNALITSEQLAEFTRTAQFTSDGSVKTAPVTENGYEISVRLTNNTTANLILEVSGTGKLTVTKAPLTVTVKDVSREYGAENPTLEEEYSGFKNGEDKSVLGGELRLSYDSSINEQTAVGTYTGVTKAEGLTSDNYEIAYVNGNLEIVKIPLNASAGEAKRSYINVIFDRSVEGLSSANFIVKDSNNNIADVENVTVSSDNKMYTLGGSFNPGRSYTVTVVLSGAAADATHNIVNGEFAITPSQTGSIGSGGSGGGTTAVYTVSFDTNGGSEVSSLTVSRNSTVNTPAAPTKDGYDFAGWYTDKELKEKYDFSERVTKNITLYAAWTEKDDSENNNSGNLNSKNQMILTIGKKEAMVFGTIKTNDVAPTIVNDRTMLPARFVAENLGAEVAWDSDNKLVTIIGKNLKTGDDTTIRIYIDSDVAYVNDREIILDSPAFIENDRTYTPIRFISEELGASVEWIEKERQVVITRTK